MQHGPDQAYAHLDELKRKWQVSLTVGLSLMVLMYLPLGVDTMDWLMPLVLVTADAAAPGRATPLLIQLTDPATGPPIDDLGRSHGVWMQLIATREDLGTFTHVHPTPTGNTGGLAVNLNFPTAGRYLIKIEFRRRGQMVDVHTRQSLSIPGIAVAPVRLAPTGRTVTVDEVHVTLVGAARADATSDLRFDFNDAASGEPINDLQPYLTAAGHVIAVRTDGSTFAHQHAEVRDDQGRPVFALPGQRFGPSMEFHVTFPTAGTYQLGGQFRLANGDVITVPFTVESI